MKPAQLRIESLLFYWRTHLAVILGVMAASAVIGGALVVGDSVHDSLRQMSLDRLGGVDHALTGARFFREELAAALNRPASGVSPARQVAPAIVMQGTIEVQRPASDRGGATVPPVTARAGHINIYGVDNRFWQLMQASPLAAPAPQEIVLNHRVAAQLGAQVGDAVSVIVEIPASIPRDALLGDRDETVTALTLQVSGIADEATTPARFGLNPSQQLPLNAFVSLANLQTHLGLNAVPRSRRNPMARPARVNALFIATEAAGDAHRSATPTGQISPAVAEELTADGQRAMTLPDLALRIVRNAEQGYLSLESEQMMLEPAVAEAARKAAGDLQVQTSPVLVYLLNELTNPRMPAAYAMYSIVAGVDFTSGPPFGPFQFVGPPPAHPLTTDDIVINDWLAADLKVDVGDSIAVKYQVVGDRGQLPEVQRPFRVAGIVQLEGAAADPGFTPFVPGITDADTFGDWRQPFPMDLARVTDRDEDYWDRYKTTPKAFMSLAAAQALWRSRYGELTSIRVAPAVSLQAPPDLDRLEADFSRHLLAELDPQATGLVVQPVKYQGLAAAAGTTDFTGLFIGFSFFLILAATILIGLLFRLGIERRVAELGLLTAVGFTPAQVRRQFLGEGAILVGAGGLLGAAAAVGYAGLMIHGLKTWWIGAIGTQYLYLSVHPETLIIGFVITTTVAGLAIVWALWLTRHLSPRDLLAGVVESALSVAGRQRRGRRAGWTAASAGGLAGMLLIASLAGLVPTSEAFGGFSWRVVAFFVVGVAALVASLSGLASWLDADREMAVRGSGVWAMARLGLRNASRNRTRTVLTASLIASATFVIVAVAAGQRNPAVEQPLRDSGNGGFTLVAESNNPLLYDLNTDAGRARLGIDVGRQPQSEELLRSMRVMPFRLQPGENASCLNLYQTRRPTILGVPEDVIAALTSERRFKFADTRAAEPWQLLTKPRDGHIPVLGDMNTLMYSLHKGIGDTLPLPDAAHPEHILEVAGMLDGSVFQGVLLMSEHNFLRLFPQRAGYQYFLIEVDPAKADALSQLLETQLADAGFDVDRVSDRLADFLAVQNTYLSTFQTLGGLGLLLGTLGLATVMLRNVLERRGELALFRAVGFRNVNLAFLVLWENACVMLWGLLSGTVSALLAMLPHLSSTGADVPWGNLDLMLCGVFAVGMIAALAAVQEALRTPILSTLRAE